MKFIVELAPNKEKLVEVPDGARAEHEVVNLCNDGKPTVMPRLQFILGEELLASFVGVMSFYRVDLTPQRNDWVTGTAR